MSTILLDTNIVIDVLQQRGEADSEAVYKLVEARKIKGMLCATTLTTVSYVLEIHFERERVKQGNSKSAAKLLARKEAIKVIAYFLKFFSVAPVDFGILQAATSGLIEDYEDAVLYLSARQAGASCIVTRNKADFQNVFQGAVPIYTPTEYLAMSPQLSLPIAPSVHSGPTGGTLGGP